MNPRWHWHRRTSLDPLNNVDTWTIFTARWIMFYYQTPHPPGRQLCLLCVSNLLLFVRLWLLQQEVEARWKEKIDSQREIQQREKREATTAVIIYVFRRQLHSKQSSREQQGPPARLQSKKCEPCSRRASAFHYLHEAKT